MGVIGRRRFLGASLAGAPALVLGRGLFGLGGEIAGASPLTATLDIDEVIVTMVDGVQVPMWSYRADDDRPVPGPVLLAESGDSVSLTITNNLSTPRGWSIPGVASSGPIAPGASTVVTFTAPAAGTYLYSDPVSAPTGQFMGLHGVLVVMPPSGATPYSSPTPQVSWLFSQFPWDSTRQWIWLFNTIDPVFTTAVAAGATPVPSSILSTYKPRYFTINGLSGFDASDADDTVPHGRVGEPAVIRIVNAGAAVHAPHIHGNHIYELARNGVVSTNALHRDACLLRPADRLDVLLPFEVPPDIHPWPPSSDFHFPMHYPMHCHMEISQTAGGGSYPQGAVTHWRLEGA